MSVEPFVVEHAAFGVALIPLLAARKPDVVYFSEWHLGRVLAAWRRLSRARFALVFCNGALAPGGYAHLDRVQQIAEGAIEYAAGRGEARDHQVLLPLGVKMPPRLEPLDECSRRDVRERLGLPVERRIVLSAGAVIRQKRVDYLIDEIASLPQPRPYLLLLGQEEAETPALRGYAEERLGSDGFAIRTVRPDAMPDHYRAADAFVLASLWESFGRVLVEAQSHGLPCLAHDYPVMSWVLGADGETADLREPGAVARWVSALDEADLSPERRARRHAVAYERFSWDRLADRYAEMLREAAALRT
jgi:1,2-diacylglycerol 3-alpha-glucosyltransferase